MMSTGVGVAEEGGGFGGSTVCCVGGRVGYPSWYSYMAAAAGSAIKEVTACCEFGKIWRAIFNFGVHG